MTTSHSQLPPRSGPSPEAHRRGVLKRPAVNITPPERVGRVAFGSAGAIAGLVLLTGASSSLAAILEVLLVLAGLDLVITGALGHCPLYKRLGHVPSSLRRQS